MIILADITAGGTTLKFSNQQYTDYISVIQPPFTVPRVINNSKSFERICFDLRVADHQGFCRDNLSDIDGAAITVVIKNKYDSTIRTITAIVENVKSSNYVFTFKCEIDPDVLLEEYPENVINDNNYPDAVDGAMDLPIPSLYGTYSATTGAIKCWKVGTGRYLIADHHIKEIDNAYGDDEIEIDDNLYTLDNNADGYSYCDAPSDSGDYILLNIKGKDDAGTLIEKPIEQLKDYFDTKSISYNNASFTAAKTIMTARNYVGYLNLAEEEKLKSILRQFCSDFDCYWILNDSQEIEIIMYDQDNIVVADQFEETRIQVGEEKSSSDNIINKLRFQYDFRPGNNTFARKPALTSGTGDKPAEVALCYIEDVGTAVDAAQRHMSQRIDKRRTVDVVFRMDDYLRIALGVGQIIELTHHSLLSSAVEQKYVIMKEYPDYMNETVRTSLQRFFDINKYIIYSYTTSGGSVSPAGYTYVDKTGNQKITATPESGDYDFVKFVIDDVDFPIAHGDVIDEGGGVYSYTFTNVTANHDIQAVFLINKVYYRCFFTNQPHNAQGAHIYPAGYFDLEQGSNVEIAVWITGGVYQTDSVMINDVDYWGSFVWDPGQSRWEYTWNNLQLPIEVVHNYVPI